MNDHQRRIARARLLRRQGRTYDEIRAVIGRISDDTLRAWLRGIPRPPETHRGRARDAQRRECRRLRAQGLSYTEIAERTGAAKGSVSPWVRDVRIPAGSAARHRCKQAASRRAVGDLLRERAAERRAALRASAQSSVGSISARDLFIAGVALYWAEGTKDKPWRHDGRVVIINSDPSVFDVFLAWLDLLGVSEAERRYRLSIHESASVAEHEAWWAARLMIPITSFARPSLKRHNPNTVRRNNGSDYHGCLVVSLERSGELYYAIEGWWAALSGGVTDPSRQLA